MKRTPRRAPRPWEAQTPGGSASTPTRRTPSSSTAARSFPGGTPSRGSPRGRGTPSRGTPGTPGLLSPDGRWLCDCVPRRRAVQRQTRKPGPNQGRWFWTCAQTDRRRQCDFFAWEEGDSSSSTIQMSIGRRTTPEPERQRPEPMTPTPMRRGAGGPVSTGAQTRQRIFRTSTIPFSLSARSTPTARRYTAADPFVDEAATPTATPRLRRQRVRPITDYFHKDGQPTLPPPEAEANTPAARPTSPSYSEDMDSETERALMALTEHAERKSREEGEEEGEEEEEPEQKPQPEINKAGIVVPTHAPPLSPPTPRRLRRGRGLLLAREERAARQGTSTATPPPSQISDGSSGVAGSSDNVASSGNVSSGNVSSGSIGIKREAEDDNVFQTPRPLHRAVTPPSSKKRRTATGGQDCHRTTDALRLLDGEPVSAAVREQLRTLLNREFGRAEGAEDGDER